MSDHTVWRNWRARFRLSSSISGTLIPLITALPLTVGLEAVGTFKKIQPVFARVIAKRTVLPNESNVALVLIDDEDHRTYFDGDKAFKVKALKEAIFAIEEARPRILGVDVDTTDSEYAELAENFAKFKIIWARQGTKSHVTGRWYPSDALGGKGNASSAISSLPVDADGIVRRYQRSFDAGNGPLWFLSSALQHIGQAPPRKFTQEYVIQYHLPPVPRMWLRDVRDLREKAELLRNKAVLLGGQYLAQDEFQTPLGWMPGVEVLAQIAETDSGKAVLDNPVTTTCTIYVSAVLVAASFIFFRFWIALAAAILEAMVFSVICARYLLPSPQWILYMIATLVLVLGNEIYREYKDKKKKAEERKTFERLKAELSGELLAQDTGTPRSTPLTP